MGNFNILSSVSEPPAVVKSGHSCLTVATLNYCGIAYSPFEFYFNDLEKEISQISMIFKELLPIYIPNFNDKFSWKMGKIDKSFKKGRYSNMFDPDVGTFWKSLLTREEFENKWEIQFKKNAASFKFQWTEEEKNTVKLYDFIMYHTLLVYTFDTKSFEDAIKKSADDFRKKIKPFYQLSFLDQNAKLKKFMEGFYKLQADVFFIQEYSNVLIEELRKSSLYVVTDPRLDSLVLLNRKSFTKIHNYKDVIDKINQEQKNNFRWAESVAFASADNYIFVCVHLSSNETKNKEQVENLRKDLLRLKHYLPKYEIIVGGDLNSFMKPDQEFTKTYHLYPYYDWEFTTLKKRTYTQAQFHKAEKEVKESKDRIISTLNIEYGEVMYLGGGKAEKNAYLPSHSHPYDHLLCFAKITK